MFDLTGKNALITGASGGIGGEIARTLHAAGATVGLSGTRVEPLEALAAELGNRAHVLPCNLSDGAAVDALPKQAAEAMGSVDILVNNAATNPYYGPTMGVEKLAYDKTFQVNLEAPLLWCKAAWEQSFKERPGTIINIASVRLTLTPEASATSGSNVVNINAR